MLNLFIHIIINIINVNMYLYKTQFKIFKIFQLRKQIRTASSVYKFYRTNRTNNKTRRGQK